LGFLPIGNTAVTLNQNQEVSVSLCNLKTFRENEIKLLFYNLVDLATDKVNILVDNLLVGLVDFGEREEADNSCNTKETID
jgi:hypothetical protein